MKHGPMLLAAIGLPISAIVANMQSGPAAVPLAYVSSQRVMAESNEGKARQARLQTMQVQKMGELKAKQQALTATRQQLAKAPDAASRSQLQQQELQQRTDFERSTLQAQAELQNLQRQTNTELQEKVRPILEQLAKERNIRMILNAESAVAWGDPGLDLTAQVVERLDAQSTAPQ